MTLPEERDDAALRPADMVDSFFLVLLWDAAEPHRAGEAALVPPGDPGPLRVLGRGPAAGALLHPRLEWQRHRPGSADPQPPLRNPRISRTQLIVRMRGPDTMEVRNVGRCRLLRDGLDLAEETVQVRAGQTLQLGSQSLFLCVRRAAWLPPPAESYPAFSFGEVDGFGLVGETPSLWNLRHRLAIVAKQRGHVLIVGASGVGKELAAQALHALSSRAHRPLVARNAATLPDGLLDAELFGTARHFPQHGMAERPGLIGSADGSTLFLDEVAELSLCAQPHLLRVLDGGQYHRLGESTSRHSDFRLIGATNRDLSTLRKDLVARFTFVVALPDLAARREDIPLLARYCLRRISREDPTVLGSVGGRRGSDALDCLRPHVVRELVTREYATNVRELEGLLWQLATATDPMPWTPVSPAKRAAENTVIEPAERSVVRGAGDHDMAARVQACLDAHNGNIEVTWRALGMRNRYILRRLIAKHQLVIRRQVSR